MWTLQNPTNPLGQPTSTTLNNQNHALTSRSYDLHSLNTHSSNFIPFHPKWFTLPTTPPLLSIPHPYRPHKDSRFPNRLATRTVREWHLNLCKPSHSIHPRALKNPSIFTHLHRPRLMPTSRTDFITSYSSNQPVKIRTTMTRPPPLLQPPPLIVLHFQSNPLPNIQTQ